MNVSGQGKWMDKLFHKKLSGFEVSPDDHVWEGIVKILDEDKKRPAIFGNWWTVLLSLMMLIATGVGAYMIYKRSFIQKTEKNQNRDLPYIQENINPESTVHINFKENISNSKHSVPESGKRIIYDRQVGINEKKLGNTNYAAITKASTNEQEPSSEIPLVATQLENVTDFGKTDFSNQLKANDLIVSTDEKFYTEMETTDIKMFSFSSLPLKESYLAQRKHALSSLSLIDGCDVYKDNKTHYFLDVYYAPEIADRSLKTSDPALQSYVEDRTNSEKPILSYSAGIKASIVFSNGLSVRGGLSYSNNSERFDFVKERQKITKEIKDQNGNVISTEVTEVVIMDKTYNQYKFVDIPVLIGYEKDLKDFVLSVNGGIGVNISASQTGKIYKNDSNKMSFHLLESNGEANAPIFRTNAGMSLIGSIGLNYKYNERIMLLLEPSARYYIHSLSDDSNPVSQRYLFLGMNIGLRYRIK